MKARAFSAQGLFIGGHAKRVFGKGLRLLTMAMLMATLAFAVIPAPEARAATILTIDVDNIADDNPGGGCTLREAIDVVNTSLGPGTAPNGCTVTASGAGSSITYEINLPSYTYTLSGVAGDDGNLSGDLDIMPSYSVSINGAGAGSTIIEGGGIDRVLHIPVAESVAECSWSSRGGA